MGRPRPLGGGVHGHTAAQEVFRQSANTKDTRSERLRSDAPANRNEVGLVTKNIHLAQVGWSQRLFIRRNCCSVDTLEYASSYYHVVF